MGGGPAERGPRLRRARAEEDGEGAVRRARGGGAAPEPPDVGEPGLRGVLRELVCSYSRRWRLEHDLSNRKKLVSGVGH